MNAPLKPLVCGSCTACCRNTNVVLMASDHDRIDIYGPEHAQFAPAPADLIEGLLRNPDALLFPAEMFDADAEKVPEEFRQAVRQGNGFAIMQLKHKENGDCVFLGEHGCTIYDRRPTVCRKFDCRVLFMNQTREERREWIKTGQMPREVYAAGRKKLGDP
jgi:Fe-S-cluster containining protein